MGTGDLGGGFGYALGSDSGFATRSRLAASGALCRRLAAHAARHAALALATGIMLVLVESWGKRVTTMAIHSLLAEFVTEWNMMMAFSVLASAPLVVAFIFLQRYVVAGMTAGAVKS